jgi:hypothetical protein
MRIPFGAMEISFRADMHNFFSGAVRVLHKYSPILLRVLTLRRQTKAAHQINAPRFSTDVIASEYSWHQKMSQ